MRGLGRRRVLRGWSAPSLVPSSAFVDARGGRAAPYAAPTRRPITYPATPPPSPITSISSPSRHHDPTVIFASYQPIPKSANPEESLSLFGRDSGDRTAPLKFPVVS